MRPAGVGGLGGGLRARRAPSSPLPSGARRAIRRGRAWPPRPGSGSLALRLIAGRVGRGMGPVRARAAGSSWSAGGLGVEDLGRCRARSNGIEATESDVSLAWPFGDGQRPILGRAGPRDGARPQAWPAADFAPGARRLARRGAASRAGPVWPRQRGGLGVGVEAGALGDHLGHQLLGLPAGGAVADGHDADVVLADEVLDRLLRLVPAVLGLVRVDHGLFEQRPVRVEHRHLAAGAETGVDRQHDLLGDRRLEQQAPQIAGEDVDGVPLGHLGQVAADLALQAGHQEAVQRVDRRLVEDLRVRVPFQGELAEDRALQVLPRDFELDLERAFLVGPVDRQDAVRRDVADRLGVVEVVAVLQPLPFGEVLALGGHDLAGLPDGATDRVADDRQLVDRFREDVADAFQHLLDGLQPLLGREKFGRRGVEVEQRLVAVPDPQGQRLQPLLAGVGGLGALLGLVGEVEVFEPLGVVRALDGVAELVRELPLGLDGLEDRLLALGQLAQALDAVLDLPDRDLVQVAGPLLAVAGDERHRVALVEQLNDGLDLDAADLQVLRDPAQVDRDRGIHVRTHRRGVYGDGRGPRSSRGTKARPRPVKAADVAVRPT